MQGTAQYSLRFLQMARAAAGTTGWWHAPQILGFSIAGADRDAEITVFVRDRHFLKHVPSRIHAPGARRPVALRPRTDAPVRLMGANAPASGAVNISRSDAGWSGTLGCLVRRPNDTGVYMLSNAHILAYSGGGAPAAGDDIVSPGFETGGRAPADVKARLTDWTRFQAGSNYPNVADAAIARLVDGSTFPNVPRQYAINDTIVGNMAVSMLGASSGMRVGQVQYANVSYSLPYPVPGGSSVDYGFQGLVRCSIVSDHGDSGSIVRDESGSVVGLLFAGSDEFSLFTPIRAVLSLLGIYIEQPAPGVAPVVPAATPPLGFIPLVQSATGAVDVLARTVWGEARNQGEVGITAVAAVIANRVRANRTMWGGHTIEGVCTMPNQFSCWNPPVTPSDRLNRSSMDNVGPENPLFGTCLDVAQHTLKGEIVDPTGGANSYFNPAQAQPNWAKGRTPTVVIGAHAFYRL